MGQSESIPSKLPTLVCAGVQQLSVDEVLADEALLKRTTQNATALYTAYRFTPTKVRHQPEEGDALCYIAGVKLWFLGIEVELTGAKTDCTNSDEPVRILGEAGESEPTWKAHVRKEGCGQLIIQFKEPTPATEFAFKTHATQPRESDPVHFKLEGSNDQAGWLTLCDTSDFAVPNARGEWTSRVGLQDPVIANKLSGKDAATKLDEATKKNGLLDLHNWLSGKVPRAPVEELSALMQCCKAQLVGEPQMRRQVLFSMLHSTCETLDDEAKIAENKRQQMLNRAKGKDKKAERATEIASLSARCAARLLVEPLLKGEPAGPLLDMLNEQLSAGALSIALPPEDDELPEPLTAALGAASDVCRGMLQKPTEAAGSPAKNLKLAEFMLRLAALRGSLGDVLAVASWLLDHPGAEVSDGLWQAARDLFEIRAPWAAVVFQGGKWLEANFATKPTAIKSQLELSSKQINGLEVDGAFIEIQLIEVADSCRVVLIPAADKDLSRGVGVQSGQAWANGELTPWEDSSACDFHNGDCVGLWLRAGSVVEVFVNGHFWGKLPECPDLQNEGCFAAVTGIETTTKVSFNVGQSPLSYPNPGGPCRSWADVAGTQTFEKGKALMEAHVHDKDVWPQAREAGERADNLVLGVLLIDMLARNASTVESSTVTKDSGLVFESPHPYNHGVDNKQLIHVPGALSMRIIFDEESRSEENCDFLQFARDQGITQLVGEQRTGPRGRRWQNLEVEGDSLWFLWHTDGSGNDWGYKFSVEVTMRNTKVPLCTQPDAETIDTLARLLQLPQNLLPPMAYEKLMKMVAPNLRGAIKLPESTRVCVTTALLALAKDKSSLGAKAVEAFAECCSSLFTTPFLLLQAQLQLWEAPDAYHPDAIPIVSGRIATMKDPFGKVVDEPDVGNLLCKFASVVVGFEAKEAGEDESAEKAARLLWRVLCDSVSHLVGERAKNPSRGWDAVLSAIQKVLESAVQALISGKEPPAFHRVLTLPILHGMASIPSFKGATWESVVGVLPPLGELFQQRSAAGVPVEVLGAALTLMSTLGRELVRLGSPQDGEDDDFSKILSMSLMSAVPRSVLGDGYAGPPPGVEMVERTTGMILNKDSFSKSPTRQSSSEGLHTAFAELIDGTSERALAAIKHLETAGAGMSMLPPRLHRLLFCILVKQQAAIDSVQKLLEAVSTGQEPNYHALPKLWLQAHHLEPWLLSVKHRQLAAGKDGNEVSQLMQNVLEILVTCEPIDPDDVKEAVEDDGLDALWEQQLMDLPGLETNPSIPSIGRPSSRSASPQAATSSSILVELTPQVQSATRLRALLKQLPRPGSPESQTVAQQLKKLFEAPWFGKADPLKDLLLALQNASMAAWRRAAGLSLLAWATQQCATGADAWVTGFVLTQLQASWQQETATVECCAESPALIALAAARQHSMSSVVKLCTATNDGRSQGVALQVMCIVALGGPWRLSDQSMILTLDVLGALRPYCPWTVEMESASGEVVQCCRAAWLALRSLVALTPGSAEEKANPFSKAVLALLVEALETMHENKRSLPGHVPLAYIFGLTTAPIFSTDERHFIVSYEGGLPVNEAFSRSSKQVTKLPLGTKIEVVEIASIPDAGRVRARIKEPTGWISLRQDTTQFAKPQGEREPWEIFYADIKGRLEAAEDFGGLEQDNSAYTAWLEKLRPFFERFMRDQGIRTLISELEQDSEGAGVVDGITWAEFDTNGDGYLDLYEALHAFVRLKEAFPTEFEGFPSRLPDGLPRIFDRSSRVEKPVATKSLLATLPVSASIAGPRCALFRCMSGLLRAQPAAELMDGVSSQVVKALVKVAVGTDEHMMEAVLALWVLRGMHKLPQSELEYVSAHLLEALATGGKEEAASVLAAQRANVLREWFQQEGSSTAVGNIIMAALRDDDAAQAGAALRVLGSASVLHTLARGYTECAAGGCTVIEDARSYNLNEFKTGVGKYDGHCLKPNVNEYATASMTLEEAWTKLRLSRYRGFQYKKPETPLGPTDVVEMRFQVDASRGSCQPNSEYTCMVEDDQRQDSDDSYFSALILQHGAALTAAVDPWALRLQREQCDTAKLKKEDRICIVDAALAARSDDAWSLITALSQADAAAHFVAKGGLSKCLSFAIETVPSWIGLFTPRERSSISALLRSEYPDVMNRAVETLDNANATEAEQADPGVSINRQVMKRASLELRMGDWPEDGSALDFSGVQLAMRKLLQKAPEPKIVRLYALQELKEAAPEHGHKVKDRCGMVDSVEDFSKKASSSEDAPEDDTGVSNCLYLVRNSTQHLETLAGEAVCWDRKVFALEACLAVVLHAGSPNIESSIDLTSASPEQMAKLCLAFQRGFDGADLRDTARSAMVKVAGMNSSIVGAVQELAIAHLFGSLGCPRTAAGSDYESKHPYVKGKVEEEETVSIASACRFRIKFDPRCKVADTKDNLIFTWNNGVEEMTHISGGGIEEQWDDFVIDSSTFKFKWNSQEGGSNEWGYKFTVIPEGVQSGPMPCFSDGLWLLDFLLDVLPTLGKQPIGKRFTAENLLRPELAAILFAHVERESDEASVQVLQRFVEACTTHRIDFDWASARHALSAMTRVAQERADQSRVQMCAALRLALPSVVVASELPRFASFNGTDVQLLHKDQVCVSQVPRDSICCVQTGLRSVLFRPMADVEAWVGVVKASTMHDSSSPVCLLRLTDGATLVDSTLDCSDPISTDCLKEVRVVLDEARNEVSFEGSGFARRLKLPLRELAPQGNRVVLTRMRSHHFQPSDRVVRGGEWCMAAKLCGFGASVGVFAPGISDSGLEQLRTSWVATKALLGGACAEDWPADFLAETFNEWWSACASTDETKSGEESQGESRYSSLEENQLLVEGAELEKYNGVYTMSTECGRHEKPEWDNEEGCKIFYEDFFMPGLCGWCMNEGDCMPPSPYAASLVSSGDQSLPAGPWFAVAEGSGKPPTVSDRSGPPTFETLADFSPPRNSTRSSPDNQVCATSVILVDDTTVVLFTSRNENCEPFLLYSEGGGEPKRVASSLFRCWGMAGCVWAPTSEWSAGTSPTLHFTGGQDFSVVQLCGLQPAKKEEQWSSLTPKLSKIVESPHPLPTDLRTTLHVAVAQASSMTLQFSRESQLPAGTIALVTQDEAGLQPVALARRAGATDIVVPLNKGKMREDAARGILEFVQGQSFSLNSNSCYIHLPASRPIEWDPLPPAPPQPIKVESPHPYLPNSNIKEKVYFPGAQRVKVTFTTNCKTEHGYDQLKFFRDESLSEHLFLFHGGGPWADVEIEGDTFWYTFTSDGGTEYWGYEFTVSPVGELEDVPTNDRDVGDASALAVFEEGVQFGASGSLLFKGGSGGDWQSGAKVTAKQCEISNTHYFGDFLYATLDNVAPNSIADKGTQSEWFMIPEGWLPAPAETAVVDNVCDNGWATDCLVFADGSAYGTANCEKGQLVKMEAQHVARCQENGKAYRPSFALARVLIRKPLGRPTKARKLAITYALGTLDLDYRIAARAPKEEAVPADAEMETIVEFVQHGLCIFEGKKQKMLGYMSLDAAKEKFLQDDQAVFMSVSRVPEDPNIWEALLHTDPSGTYSKTNLPKLADRTDDQDTMIFKLVSRRKVHLKEALTVCIRASESSFDSITDSVSGMVLDPKPILEFAGHACWNLDESFLEYESGPKPITGQSYTHAVWVYWRASDNGWRTLLRGNNDHSVVVGCDAKNLGMLSNRNGDFRDCGYDIDKDMTQWQLVIVAGEGQTEDGSVGTSTFYTAAEGETEMHLRGTSDRVVSGTSWYRLGWPSQGPGKVAAVYQWNRVLSIEEMNKILKDGIDGRLIAKAAEPNDDDEPSYIVRQSKAALTWLRPGLLAGEMSIDFSGGRVKAADIAVGVTVGVQRSFVWPSLSETQTQTKEAEATEVKDESEEKNETETPQDNAADELLITCPCRQEFTGTYKKSSETQFKKEGGSEVLEKDTNLEGEVWALKKDGDDWTFRQKSESGLPLGMWRRYTENGSNWRAAYAGLQVVHPLSESGPRRFAPVFEGCWVGHSDGLRKATIIGAKVQWYNGSQSTLQYKDRNTVSTISSSGKFVTGALNADGSLKWTGEEQSWVRAGAYKFNIGDKVMLTTNYEKYADGGNGPVKVGKIGTVANVNSGSQQPFNCNWWYEWACLTRAIDEQTEGWMAFGVGEGKYDGNMSASSELQDGDALRSANRGQLNNTGGHWCADTDHPDPNGKHWLQIDLGRVRQVTGVATQGASGEDNAWTKAYELQASDDGTNWRPLRNEDGYTKFLGNGDNTGVIRHMLDRPADTRYLRFIVEEWESKACLRVEVYRFQDPPQAWWWRCNGGSYAWDTGSRHANAAATFGAGDVVGVTVSVEDKQLRRLELMRNGRAVAHIEMPAGSNPLPEDDNGGCNLALSVGLRRSSTCISLLPAPQVLEHLPPPSSNEDEEEKPLESHEEQMAMTIFKAIDVSGDGSLDKKELSAVLGGVRGELFAACDADGSGMISESEWLLYCKRIKSGNGLTGLSLFLDAFRKKLLHIGRNVTFEAASSGETPAYGIHVTAKPNGFTTQGMLEAAREVVPDDWARFKQLAIDDWSGQLSELHVAVLSWLEKGSNGVTKDAFKWDLSQFRLAAKTLRDERDKVFPAFTESDERFLARFVVIRKLNMWVRDRMLPYTDLAALLKTPFGRTFSEARGLLFGSWKSEHFNKIVEETFTNDQGSLHLNRNLQTEIKSADECDVGGTQMLFAQSSLQVEQGAFGLSVFRSRGPSHNRPIEISYVDESGVDHGGLYRDWLDACATELMSTHLPLFVQTPNGRNNAGEDRQAWLLSPTPLTSASTRMLNFLGKIMGICLRRGDVLPLSLSRMFWKLLVSEQPTIQDLELSDVAAAESIKQLMDLESIRVGPDDFDSVFGDIRFVYHNSQGVEVPLMDGGVETQVTYDNAKHFAELVLKMRISESAEQMECIRAGLACVVPVSCLSLWSWRDLEIRVCGNPTIDVELLKKYAIYESIEKDHDAVKFMWKALETFSQDDLKHFVRFVWGRSRLPPDGNHLWGNGFKITGARDIPPEGLPRAHTCYFQIDLPLYENQQVATKQIQFAVRNCVSMLNQ